MNRFASSLIVMFTCCAVCAADDISFSETVTVNEQTLYLSGTGVLSKWFIKGCKMALYTPKEIGKADILQDHPRCLEFYYYRDIKAEQFAVAAWNTMKKNWPEATLKARRNDIDTLHGFYRDVSAGDRYKLLYVPNTGTTLFLNGALLGTVTGAQFAEIYFSIWLGDNPIDGTLKQLLTAGLK